jgi:hypothetical protein
MRLMWLALPFLEKVTHGLAAAVLQHAGRRLNEKGTPWSAFQFPAVGIERPLAEPNGRADAHAREEQREPEGKKELPEQPAHAGQPLTY